MSDARTTIAPVITKEAAAQRFAQGLSLLELFTQVWLSNPALAKQAGKRVEEFVLPLEQVRLRHVNDLQ